MWKLTEGKITLKREFPLNQRDYKRLSALYYIFNFQGFDSLQRRERLTFIAER